MASEPDETDGEISDETAAIDILEAYALQIMGHFDTVQIIATRHDPNAGTSLAHVGRGNIYARVGACREWMMKLDTETRIQAKDEYRDGDVL